MWIRVVCNLDLPRIKNIDSSEVCITGLLVGYIGKDCLGDEGGLGGLVAFFAHVEAEGEEGDDRGEGYGGDSHGDDDFGEAEGRWLTQRTQRSERVVFQVRKILRERSGLGVRKEIHGAGARVGRARPVYLVRRTVSKLLILDVGLVVVPVTVPSKKAIPLVGKGERFSSSAPSD